MILHYCITIVVFCKASLIAICVTAGHCCSGQSITCFGTGRLHFVKYFLSIYKKFKMLALTVFFCISLSKIHCSVGLEHLVFMSQEFEPGCLFFLILWYKAIYFIIAFSVYFILKYCRVWKLFHGEYLSMMCF